MVQQYLKIGNTQLIKMKKDISPFLIRLGLGIVVLWFSISQILDPTKWTFLVPSYTDFLNPVDIIYINAGLEAIIGILLIFGMFTRFVGLIFSLHLIPIIFALGYGPIAVRDFGLLMASLSLVFSGSGNYTLVNFIKRKN